MRLIYSFVLKFCLTLNTLPFLLTSLKLLKKQACTVKSHTWVLLFYVDMGDFQP